MTTTSTL